MAKVEMLRAFVNQRLTAAADEIFQLFERTIAEYEEKLEFSLKENNRQRKLLDAVYNPEVRLHRADVLQLSVVRNEGRSEGQEWISSLDQEDSEPSHIKEEQEEEVWTSRDREKLQELKKEDFKFPLSAVTVKSEEDEEERAQYSQPHGSQTEEDRETTEADGEDCGGSAAVSPLQPAIHDRTETESEDSSDWEGMEERRSSLNHLESNEVTGSDVECKNETVDSSEYVRNFVPQGHLQVNTGDQTGQEPFSCSVCGIKVSYKCSLMAHMRLHSEEKSFSCLVCKTSFRREINLANHMRTHTGEKPFSCSLCSRRFTMKRALSHHLVSQTCEKTFKCSVCSKTFAGSRNLRRHLAVHTGEKLFSCSLCSKTFSQKVHLTQHKIVHTGEKPFNCSVCSKTFSQKVNLRRHKTVHTGEKPFSCSVCSKTFARSSHLKRHMTVHTGE